MRIILGYRNHSGGELGILSFAVGIIRGPVKLLLSLHVVHLSMECYGIDIVLFIADGVHKIPVSQLEISSQGRTIRPIDEKVIESLMPEGNYDALSFLCKNCESKADLDIAKLH